MKVSTRTRYGLRMMINLAETYGKGYLLLKNIAASEQVSEKYLSQIVIPLRRAGFITGSRGANGGYCLLKPPSGITAKEIIEVLEGDLSVTDCINDPGSCERFANCPSLELWKMLSKKISESLESITLEDLLKIKEDKDTSCINYNI